MEHRPLHAFYCECDRCGPIIDHGLRKRMPLIDRICVAIMLLAIVLIPGRAAWAALASMVATW